MSFAYAEKEFKLEKASFGQSQQKTLGLMNSDGIYTNLGLLLSDQCIHTDYAFSDSTLIEVYGTGVPKIMQSHEGSFAAKPKIEVTDNAFKITLLGLRRTRLPS